MEHSRSKLPAVLAVLFCIALLAGVGVLLWKTLPEKQKPEQAETIRRMRDAAHEVEVTVKDFVLQSPQDRAEHLSAFCDSLVQRLGALESAAE